MPAEDKRIILFTTRVRQMILHYNEVRQENKKLQDTIRQKEQLIGELNAKLRQAEYDYNSLKMAKMIEITDGDMDKAKVRLSRLIRDVNKCITLLSEK
jgi:predicted  nucleic acid-binding Zn-ribbon protein